MRNERFQYPTRGERVDGGLHEPAHGRETLEETFIGVEAHPFHPFDFYFLNRGEDSLFPSFLTSLSFYSRNYNFENRIVERDRKFPSLEQ